VSVISVSDRRDRGGGWTSERKGPVLELTNRRYKRVLNVITNDPNDGPEVVVGGAGVPQIGDTYALGNDLDNIAVCIDVQAKPTDSLNVWYVEAHYDSSRVVDLALSNPLNLPAEVTWEFAKYERPIQRDVSGIPYVNSSNERFDPPCTFEDNRAVLRVSRNEASYNEGNAILYQDACNTDTFGPGLPLQAKLTGIRGQKMVDIGVTYWKVDYEIEFRREGFATFVLDQGFRNITGYLFRDQTADNSPMANATLLNGRGYRMIDTYCQLNAACGVSDTTINVANPASYTGSLQPKDYFPPGPKLGTPHWYFEVQIDQEVMQVQGGFGTSVWNVQRGYAGTTPAAHAVNATVQLQPYYLRFVNFKQLPFAPLNLPTS
jgi:hypothetical protein